MLRNHQAAMPCCSLQQGGLCGRDVAKNGFLGYGYDIIVGPVGSVIVLPVLILNHGPTIASTPPRGYPEDTSQDGARPIIALYDQTQDAVGGGGSKPWPKSASESKPPSPQQAADSNARIDAVDRKPVAAAQNPKHK